MIPCILILTLSGDCVMRDGKCLCVKPGELVAELEAQPDMWERLEAALEQVKETKK